MEKNRLLIFPFLAGLLLMGISWYQSYSIVVVSANDLVFNHVSVLYWFSLPLLLGSMFLMAIATRNNLLKWILSIGIMLTIFSLMYFYSMLPTGDSTYFRGMMEYFIKTKNLDPSQLNHNYYQWPAFFVLADIVTSVSGLPLANYEFLLYTIIGFLLATALYVYASKKHKMAGFLVVAAFFISINYFIDYQAAPFSLALGLLFLLFMLETRQKSTGLIITIIVLYASLLITHLFVPLFFVLYLLFRSLVDRNKQNRSWYQTFSLLALVSYFLIQLTIARFNFGQIITNLTKAPVEYSIIISSAVATSSVSIPLADTAQFFSRTVTIAFVGLCVFGSIFLLIKRKMDAVDKAILFTGLFYSALGAVLNSLGYRALAVVLFPISLGAAFLFKVKFRSYFAGLFLVLLILFLFVPIHQSFSTGVSYHTRETYQADNFFADHYNWEKPGFVVEDFRTLFYTESKLSLYKDIHSGLQASDKPDAILYTPPFVGLELGNYSSMDSLSQGEKLNVEYNDGFSFVLIKSS